MPAALRATSRRAGRAQKSWLPSTAIFSSRGHAVDAVVELAARGPGSRRGTRSRRPAAGRRAGPRAGARKALSRVARCVVGPRWKSDPKATLSGGRPASRPTTSSCLLEAHRRRARERGPTAWPAIPRRTARRGPSPSAGGAARTAGACGTHVQRSAARREGREHENRIVSAQRHRAHRERRPPRRREGRMAPQYIFTMKDLRKVTPQGKEILKGIWLSFYPRAKIGVLGGNGAGKSTLLRIMAGVDKDFAGEAFAAAGTRIGFLPQEPQLDAGQDRPRDRRGGGGRRSARSSPAVRGALRELVGRERGRARPPAGPDRRPEPLGARPPRRDRHGRPARCPRATPR